MKKLILTLTALLSVGCASSGLKPPASLSGRGTTIWYANEAAIALDAVRDVTLALNQTMVCDSNPAGADSSGEAPKCHPMLAGSDARMVIAAVKQAHETMLALSTGWVETVNAAIRTIEAYLSDSAMLKLGPYLDAVKIILRRVSEDQATANLLPGDLNLEVVGG